MLELKGKYNTCKVFTDNIESAAIAQLINMMNQDSTKDSKIRIMPDTHAGRDNVIGTTMTITNKIIPNLVSGDIGCGMLAIKIDETNIDFAKLDDVIRKYIPSGHMIHEKEQIDYKPLDDLIAPIVKSKAIRSIGTLGGGNHFIEVNKDSNSNYWLVIHTGSRYLGKAVFKYHQDKAYETLIDKASGGSLNELSGQLIQDLKNTGRQREISYELEQLKKNYTQKHPKTPKAFAYCEGQAFNDYLHDMRIAQNYAALNRKVIAETICSHMEWVINDRIETIHNYIDIDDFILRKGAVSAKNNERLIIPMNMRDGSLLCRGLGNPDWNYSAPHGAGRVMSRGEAKHLVHMNDYENAMDGIYTTSVNETTIDEAPMVYKPMDEIIDNIKDTVNVIDIIKPVYNFKASAEKAPWMN